MRSKIKRKLNLIYVHKTLFIILYKKRETKNLTLYIIFPILIYLIKLHGKTFLLRHFLGHVLNRNNPSFIRVRLSSKEYFISPIFCSLDFKITNILEKYFCGYIHA
jgi:hypothetical protein